MKIETEILAQIESCQRDIAKMNRASSHTGYIYNRAYADALCWVLEIQQESKS